MRRRVILIEEPPNIWIDAGLFYVDFLLQDGSILAFRPSVWLAGSAIGAEVTREWQDCGAQIIPCCAPH